MKRQFGWLIIGAVVVIASCSTTGDIGMDMGADRTFHISPANEDGIQDQFVIPASVVPVERSVIKYYRVEVADPYGNIVYATEETAERGRFFWQRRRQTVETPEIVAWDGTLENGRWAPDGGYRVSFEVRDNRDRTERIDDIAVFVDNRPPVVQAAVAFPAFSPNGDGRLDTITIFQRRSSIEEEWSGEMRNESGSAVGTWTWNGAATDLVWDGSDSSGTVLPSGIYSYHVTSTDLAGNTGSFEVPSIELDIVPRSAVLAVDLTAISPNDDGVQDRATFRITSERADSIRETSLVIVDVAGREVRSIRPSADGGSAVFDGRGDDGVVVPDGSYRGVVSIAYSNGDVVTTASPLIEVDTIAPNVVIAPAYMLFSPDADGRRDTITIRQSSGYELETNGEIIADTGATIRRYTWSGPAADFDWDGTDDDGIVVPDGIYRYRVASRDSAGNQATNERGGIRVDTRPTPVMVRPSAEGFSPNNDGRYDTVSFRLSSTTDAAIDTWSFELRGRQDAAVYRVEGNGALPRSAVVWNGTNNIGASGTPQRVPDGAYAAYVTVAFEKGNLALGSSESVFVDTTAPVVSIGLPDALFSPDGDGRYDTLPIEISLSEASGLQSWGINVRDPQGREFWNRSGAQTLPGRIVWDGLSANGELVQSSSTYALGLVVEDVYGNVGRGSESIDTDILVIRQGEEFKIVLSNINFAPFTADFINVAPEIAAANIETLDRAYAVLTDYPGYAIRIEGHAVSLQWADPVRARREQQEVLIPLSRARADAIRRALIQRGIDAGRVTTRGFGGASPVVPHSDETNRWKSRRVEFILYER